MKHLRIFAALAASFLSGAPAAATQLQQSVLVVIDDSIAVHPGDVERSDYEVMFRARTAFVASVTSQYAADTRIIVLSVARPRTVWSDGASILRSGQRISTLSRFLQRKPGGCSDFAEVAVAAEREVTKYRLPLHAIHIFSSMIETGPACVYDESDPAPPDVFFDWLADAHMGLDVTVSLQWIDELSYAAVWDELAIRKVRFEVFENVDETLSTLSGAGR